MAKVSGQDDYSTVSRFDHQFSPSTINIINHLADRLAVRLKMELTFLRREIAAVYSLYQKDSAQAETAHPFPDPFLSPSDIRQGDLQGSRGVNEREGPAKPNHAQLSGGMGHHRSFSFQLGDDSGSAEYGTQRVSPNLLLENRELIRSQGRNTTSTDAYIPAAEATNQGEESPLSSVDAGSTRARRELSNRSVLTAIKHTSVRSTQSSTHSSSSMSTRKTRDSPAPSTRNPLAMAAARVAEARNSSDRKSIDSDDPSTC